MWATRLVVAFQSAIPSHLHFWHFQASLFSPSLFSLHDRGHGLERELSLPNLLRGSGQLTGRDQQEWLNLILETSGVNQQIDALQV